MQTVFITPTGVALGRWQLAFPKLVVQPSARAYLAMAHHPEQLCWIDVSAFSEGAAAQEVAKLVAAEARVIALSAVPDEAEAFRFLSAGARGYCHAEAVPEQLQEVAKVVTAGGYWMPTGLVQRLVAVASRAAVDTPQPAVEGFDLLTHREYEVALEIGKGANNKEIAASLEVSERTVKAHLTAIFEKLGLRDRVQLALAVNRLPIH